MPHYLACDRCGYHNDAHEPTLTFCEQCGHKLSRCYSAWQQRHPEQGIEAFWDSECVSEPTPAASHSTAPQHSQTWIMLAFGALAITMVVVLLALPIGRQAKHLTGFSPEEINFLSSDTSRWQEFCGDEGRFRVYMPMGKAPIRTLTTTPTDIGSVDMTMYTAEQNTQKHPNILYSVAFADYPRNFMAQYAVLSSNIDALLDDAVHALLQGSHAQLISASAEKFNHHQGRSVLAEIGGGTAIIDARFYLVHSTVYCLQVVAPAESYPNEAAAFFLSSFEPLSAE